MSTDKNTPQLNFWQRITSAHPSIESATERRFASVLSMLLLAFLPLYFLPESIRAILEKHSLPDILYLGSGVLFLTVAYVFSRSPYPRWGSRITILYFSLLPFAALFVKAERYAGDNVNEALIWTIPVMLLALTIVPPKQIKFVVFAHIGFYLIIPALWDGLTHRQVFSTLWLVIAVGGLVIISAYVQGRYLEQARREAKQNKISERRFREIFLGSPVALWEADFSQIKIRLDSFAEKYDNEIRSYILQNPEAMVGAGSSVVLLDANNAALDFYEAEDIEILKKSLHVVVSPDAMLALRDGVVELWEGEKNKPIETIHKTLTGKERNVIVRFSLRAGYEDTWERVNISIDDVTEQRKAEVSIRQLASAVEASASSILITDLDGRIEYVNPAFSLITGYGEEEVIGQKVEDIQKSGEHPEEFYETLNHIIESGQVWKGEVVNRRKDGSLYWESLVISSVKNDDGERTHRVQIKEDITRRKELEQALALAHEEALVASDMKTQLLANVSHDMRTPLGAILGYTEMLDAGVFAPLNAKQAEATRAIAVNTQKLLDFVSNLLSQAQIDTGKIILNPAAFVPQHLVDALGGELSLARTQGLSIETIIDPKLPEKIMGDSYWLGQILHNLLSNAIKFTPQEGEIKINLFKDNDISWALQVSDNGKGIPQEAQEYIFESFRQVDGSPTRQAHTGSGLGLSIVSHLCRLMNGEIKLESEEGKGSIFTIFLPLYEAEER
ncbi:MAG: PAS domain S-box protein [Chloroflexi bacterium]|nr:PAS domain S-box protein [Chloroflexota bacterium]